MSQGRRESSVGLRHAVGDVALGVTAFFLVAALAYVAIAGVARTVFGPDAGPSGIYVLLALMAGWQSTRSTLALRKKQRRESLNAQRDALLRSGRCPTCDYDLTGNVSGKCPECGSPVMAREESHAGGAGGPESTKARYTVADFLLGASAFLIVATLAFVAFWALAERWLGPEAVSPGVAALLASIPAWYAARGIMAARRKRRGKFARAHRHAQPGSEGCRTCDHDLTATTDICSECEEPAWDRPNQPGTSPDRPRNE
jgi:uncharacterized paraquat-inducible protein A